MYELRPIRLFGLNNLKKQKLPCSMTENNYIFA